jgi:dTDP-4-amino-4,6-dideoxygalactose transaminase
MIKFLDLQAQYARLSPQMDEAIHRVIEESAFIGGTAVGEFERAFAQYLMVGGCAGVANGTDAIEIIIEALALPPGSEVIVPANSFVGSSEPVVRAGHKLVFADVDPGTYTLDAADVARRISPRTRAVVAVHLYGQPCPMDELWALAKAHDLRIIEDCAQAHGAEYAGQKVGTLGDAAAFSFYPGKNLGAYGDAGAIVSNNADLLARCRMIANHGRIEKYNHLFDGRNSRLDGIQAAVLNVKLPHLESWVQARIRLAAAYAAGLAGVGDLALPAVRPNARHAYHLYVVRTARRDALVRALKDAGIQTGIHYPIALPKLPAYQALGQQNEPMFANRADATLLSLPIGEHLDERDIRTVVEAVRAFYDA